MRKNFILLLASASILLISGCAKKDPKPSSNLDNEIVTDTVSIDENNFDSSASGGFNSSSDGMKSLYFGFGEYALTSEMQNTVAFNKKVLDQKLQSGEVKLEGNCDEFGTDEYNIALGLKRSKAVKDSLVAQGVNGSKIVLVSYGESNPQCKEPTDSCYSRNRRVDLHLVR